MNGQRIAGEEKLEIKILTLAERCVLEPRNVGSITQRCYRLNEIFERHRHRYEFNNNYLELLSGAGLNIVGKSSDGMLVEVVEIEEHPWFVGCQFHPEFTSSPIEGHPLFTGFINAAIKHDKNKVM